MTPNKKRWLQFAPFAVLVIFLITSPTFLGTSYISILTKILIYGLLAMSLDLTFGYTGLWCFGQAAIFGAGAYTTGILITRLDVNLFWIAGTAGVVMSAITAAIFAFISLRVSKLYFMIVTLALGQIIYSIAVKWYSVTQGLSGLGGVPYPDLGFLSPASFSPSSYYYFTVIIFLICAFFLYIVINSSFGYSLRGIRENETRMSCLGNNTWLLKFIAFTISGLLSGVAGVLYVYFNGLISPADVNMMASGTAMLMVIIGGIGTLWGGLTGAAVIIILQHFVGSLIPLRWPLIMGIVFIAVVIFLRGGIFPYLNNLWRRLIKL